MKAAIYCRVSTDDQEREGTSLQTQHEACLKYCQDKGYEVTNHFSESYSGKTIVRPKLNELMNIVRAGDIEVVVIYALDRFSRNATQGVILRDELDRHHVLLESVTEEIDKTPLGEAITYLRGTFAQIEAEKIRERTMRGKDACLKNGKLPQGTGTCLYGYGLDKANKRMLIIDHEAENVRKIFDMVINGASTVKITTCLNESGVKTKKGSAWFPSTVRRLIQNPSYAGKFYFRKTKRVGKSKLAQPKENWILLPNVSPSIITDEIYNQAQEALKYSKQAWTLKPRSSHLLTGFIRCSKCGLPMVGTTVRRKYRYYKCCGTYSSPIKDKICDVGYIKADEIERFVCERLNELFYNNEDILFSSLNIGYYSGKDTQASLDKQIKQVKARLKKYPVSERNLYSLLTHDAVTKDIVLDEVNGLKRRKKEDESKLNQLLEKRSNSIETDFYEVKLSDFIKTWRQVNPVPSKNLAQGGFLRNFMRQYNVHVSALPGKYKLTCFIDAIKPLDIKPNNDYNQAKESRFVEMVKELELKHPELSFLDLIDHAVTIPEDTSLGKAINQIKKNNLASKKNLVIIERSSA